MNEDKILSDLKEFIQSELQLKNPHKYASYSEPWEIHYHGEFEGRKEAFKEILKFLEEANKGS